MSDSSKNYSRCSRCGARAQYRAYLESGIPTPEEEYLCKKCLETVAVPRNTPILSAYLASVASIPVNLLFSWQIAVTAAILVHERNHPALAVLTLAPVTRVLFSLISTLHPLASLRPLSSEEVHNWTELHGLAPVRPFSTPWFARALLIVTYCGIATIGLIFWYGSYDLLLADFKNATQSLAWWVVFGALTLVTFFLYSPLWLSFKRFARASGLTDSRPWRALATGLGVWLWFDAMFAAIHQQLSLQCHSPTPLSCGGSVAYTETLTSFLQAFYFSTMTLATVGYGDIAPVAGRARALVTLEVIVGIGLLGFILGRVAGFASTGKQD